MPGGGAFVVDPLHIIRVGHGDRDAAPLRAPPVNYLGDKSPKV
jgi:hypothetical protein